jgi:2-alkenal reductase
MVVLLVLALGLAACSAGGGDDDADEQGTRSVDVPATIVAEQTSNEIGGTTTSNTSSSTDSPDDDDDSNSQTESAFTSYADLVEAVNPAVVTVLNEQTFGGLFGSGGSTDPQPVGSGTGFIISDDGYIVTNNHVVEGSDELSVIYYDGSEAPAELIGSDPMTDLAVIQVQGDVPGVAELGDSDELRPGDRVIAIGSPLGDYTNTVTEGIVSALDRRFPTESGTMIEDMIQHDAAINPGNSGGPLFNVAGEVVGVNTLVVRRSMTGVAAEGLGFAVPSNTVELVSEDLIDDGEVERPFMGILYQLLSPRAAAALDLEIDHGALVTDLSSGGPAREAGVRVDDVITAIDGEDINQQNSLQSMLFKYKPGDTITLTILRAGETLELELTLDVRPSNL